MLLRKRILKEHYKYSNYEEVKSWDYNTYADRLYDIDPEIIIKMSTEWLEEYRKTDPNYFEQKIKYGR
jgi:hypothetical protein